MSVVVLGDLARSPRMQYHALAIAETGARVDLVAQVEAEIPAAILEHPRIRVHALPPPRFARRHRWPRPLFVAAAATNAALQSAALGRALLSVERPTAVLAQTPPAVPTLPLVRAISWTRGARMIIDWHNLSDGVLAERLGPGHPLVRASAGLERALARLADEHLAVSEALRAFLERDRGARRVTLLHDRPGPGFARIPEGERAEVRARLAGPLGGPLRAKRLLVSPSGFTADEDLEVLALALERAPLELDVVLTGKGPLRARWEARFSRHENVRFAWLSREDYARLLGVADLGLSLHRSSSGLDLPMKILDLFGSGVPVLAYRYGPVLDELVREGENARVFSDAAGLAALLADPAAVRGLSTGAGEGWMEHWQARAREVVLG